ncbi:hypothetical protein DFH07DRAFT_991135 [Mycena maculata]|uniref:Uncharacterized protein n=1 Tax=Mycena maculata TaxID=230809 RepID=A0AAD7NSA7_9AGAR|nr:hypothetical protein DFH07DRAFT_991135 [Mycena maculata]
MLFKTSTSTARVLDVPPELWALVAKLSGRQALARLCAVSHGFDAVFSPLLYGTATTDPPLKGAQTERLIRALAQERSVGTPHRGSLVRRLVFPAYGEHRRIGEQACFTALERLFEASGEGYPVRPSALRALKWDLECNNLLELEASMTKLLGPLLRTPGCFPHLKEISIQCPVSCTHFDFLRIPDLEKVEVSLMVCDYETWHPSCDALGAELASLPESSPRLRSLNLKLSMSGGSRQSTTPPPWAAYAALLAAVNALHFPALASLALAVDTAYADPPPPSSASASADFTPILRAHPCLTHLALRAPATPADALLLPRLQTFTGAPAHCAAVAARAPALASLSLRFVERRERLDESTLPALFPPGVAPTLARLTVRAVDEADDDVSWPSASLDTPTLACLAAAFPNLTDLDVSLAEELKDYTETLAALSSLECICLRLYEDVSDQPEAPAEQVFPPGAYAAHIPVSVLERLARVRVVLRGDREPWSVGCESCDERNMRCAPGPLWALYSFGVRRMGTKGERVLVLE